MRLRSGSRLELPSSQGLTGVGRSHSTMAHLYTWLLAGRPRSLLRKPSFGLFEDPHIMAVGFSQSEWSKREKKEEGRDLFICKLGLKYWHPAMPSSLGASPQLRGGELGSTFWREKYQRRQTYFRTITDCFYNGIIIYTMSVYQRFWKLVFQKYRTAMTVC